MLDTKVLARRNCNECGASGRLATRELCGCVYAKMFRECLKTYRLCREQQFAKSTSTVVELINGMPFCSRPSEEYIVDFERICKRTCAPGELRVLRSLFSVMYDRSPSEAFAARLGKAIYEIKPYSLYPPASYFNPAIMRVAVDEEV
jgi:hypothetical protein